MNRRNYLAIMAIFFTAVLLLSTGTLAGEAKTYKVVNSTGATASDVHITFSGTGGIVGTRLLYQPAACGQAVIPAQPPTLSGYSEIIWPSACVANGDSIIIQVLTTNTLAFAGGYWTDPTHTSSPGIGPVNAGDLTPRTKGVPSLTTWGIVILLALILGSGVFVLRRRRAVA